MSEEWRCRINQGRDRKTKKKSSKKQVLSSMLLCFLISQSTLLFCIGFLLQDWAQSFQHCWGEFESSCKDYKGLVKVWFILKGFLEKHNILTCSAKKIHSPLFSIYSGSCEICNVNLIKRQIFLSLTLLLLLIIQSSHSEYTLYEFTAGCDLGRS